MDNASLKYFIETAPIAAAMIDADMKCIVASPLWIQQYVSNPKSAAIFDQDSTKCLPFFRADVLDKVLAGELQQSDSDKYITPDGRTHWIKWEFRPWLDDKSSFKYSIIFVEDISDTKRAENSLLENADRFRLAQKVANIGIWDYDLSTGEAWLNDEFYNVYGLPTDFDFNYEAFLLMVHPEDKDYLMSAHQTELYRVGKVSADYRIIRVHDGEIRWISSTGEVLTDKDGNPHRVIGTVMDITERKLIETKLQEADKRKDEFIATLSHELRNPLASTDLTLKALKKFKLEDIMEIEFIQECIDKAEKNIQHINRLLEDLLDTSRISSGRFQLRKTKSSIRKIISNALSLVKEKVENKQLTIDFNNSDEDILIDVDDIRILQVITNLMDNAIKYSNNGGEIILSAQRVGSDLLFSIKDQGAGIQRDYLETIFDMFNRSHHASNDFTGDGIGLALCRAIVELHGGTIIAKSDGLGKGSEFFIKLPNVVCS